MMSEQVKEKRNKWYRDNVKKYCVSVNKKDIEVINFIENLLKHHNFSFYVKNYFTSKSKKYYPYN